MLTGIKLAQFHHNHHTVHYIEYDVDPLQIRLRLPLFDEFDQNLAGLRPPNLNETSYDNGTTVNVHVEALKPV